MSVDYPDEFTLNCDSCSNTVSVDVDDVSDDGTFMVGFPKEDLPEGWSYDLDNDEHYCPNCS